jgi:Transglycosylase SLT domain
MSRIARTGGLVLAICLISTQGYAQSSRPNTGRAGDLCQQAIAGGTSKAHIPAGLLGAIGRVESGRLDPHDGNVKAWPWSINAEGRGYAFNTKAEAIAAVLALQARNVISVDVGCMQVNLMYHPSAFASLDEAFDPPVNVRYAAKFLTELFAETKDWNLAAAFYHSKIPDRALSYQRKVLAQLPGAARVQVIAAEQVSLTNAWTATLGTPQSYPMEQASTARDTARPVQQKRPRPLMLASRR